MPHSFSNLGAVVILHPVVTIENACLAIAKPLREPHFGLSLHRYGREVLVQNVTIYRCTSPFGSGCPPSTQCYGTVYCGDVDPTCGGVYVLHFLSAMTTGFGITDPLY